MIDALRSGGWLLLEEVDFLPVHTFAVLQGGSPAAEFDSKAALRTPRIAPWCRVRYS